MAYRTKRIPIRVDEDDHADFHAAADREELETSEWFRQLGEKRMDELERKGWTRPSKRRRRARS